MGRVGSVDQKKLPSRRRQVLAVEGQARIYSNIQARGPRASVIHHNSLGLRNLEHALFFQASLFLPTRGNQHLFHRAILQVNWMMVVQPPGLGRQRQLFSPCLVLWQLQRSSQIYRTSSRRAKHILQPRTEPIQSEWYPMDSRFKHKHKWMRLSWPKWGQGSSFI